MAYRKEGRRRRKKVLALFVVAAMLLSYLAIPVLPGLDADAAAAVNVYAADEQDAPWQIECDEPEYSVTENYSCNDMSWYFFVDINQEMEDGSRFLAFQLSGDGSDHFYLNTDVLSEHLSEGSGFGIFIIPDVAYDPLPQGDYDWTLSVYYDPSGTGSFNDASPAATHQLTLHVTEDPRLIKVSLEPWLFFDDVKEGYLPEKAMATFGLSYKEKPEGEADQTIGDFVKFEFAGRDKDAFSLSGYDETWTVGPGSSGDKKIGVLPKAGLAAGEYDCTLNVYVDQTGNGNFEEDPTYSSEIEFVVQAREEYEMTMNSPSFGRLPVGYSDEQASSLQQYIEVTNDGANPFTIDPSELNTETEGFDITLLAEQPIAIAPGETVKVALVTPKKGLPAGVYEYDYTLAAIGVEDVQQWATCSLSVLNDGLSLQFDRDKVDFGITNKKFKTFVDMSEEGAAVIRVMNDGTVPLRLTGATTPAGPYCDAELGYELWGSEEENKDLAPGESTNIRISLDPDSEEASKIGKYDGSYVIRAAELNEDGELMDGGQTADFEIPVSLEISDETYNVTLILDDKEQIVLRNEPKGSKISSLTGRALVDRYGWDIPQKDGYVFGNFNIKPLFAYDNWDDFDRDQRGIDWYLTKDITLYAIWLPEMEIDAAKIDIESPLPGATADNPPVIHVPEGAPYYVREAKWMSKPKYKNSPIELTAFHGTFEDGETYYVDLHLESRFPYAFPNQFEYDTLPLFVNGQPHHSYDTNVSGMHASGIAVQAAAEDSIVRASVTEILEKTYDGKAVAADPAVKWQGKALVRGTDYDFHYETAAGKTVDAPADAGDYVAVFTGLGSYTGTKKLPFTIEKANQRVCLNTWSYTKTFGASPFNLGASSDKKGKLVYSSDNPKVAAVDKNGKVTLKGAGRTGITVHAQATKNYNESYAWVDIIVKPKKITPAVTLSKRLYTYNGKVQKPAVTVKNGKTKLGASDYTVTIKNSKGKTVKSPKAAGTYKVTVKMKGNYSGSKTVSYSIKKTNPLKASGKKQTISYKTLKKKNQTIAAKKAFSVSKNQGKVTYKKTKGNKKITVSSTGKITVKKGLAKGSYTVEVKLTAAGNSTYKSGSKTVKIKIVVK